MPLVGTSKKKWSTKVSLYINIFIFVLADRMMTNCNIYPGKKTWPQFPDGHHKVDGQRNVQPLKVRKCLR